MTSKTMSKPRGVVPKPKAPQKQVKRVFSAQEKCEVVLSLWSERRKPSAIAKEMEITWCQMKQWQEKALTAMLEALKPRTRQEQERGPALGEKLEKMLKKANQRTQQLTKLEKRLERIQEGQKSA